MRTPVAVLDRLLEELIEPVGRAARRRAVPRSVKQTASSLPRNERSLRTGVRQRRVARSDQPTLP